MALTRETCIPVWKKAEPDVIFNADLLRAHAHARRVPYRVLPAVHTKPLDVDPVAFDSVLRVHPYGLEVGTVRGEYAKQVGWSKFSAFFMWSFALFLLGGIFWSIAGARAFLSFYLLFVISAYGFAAYCLFCFGFYFWRMAHIQTLDDPVMFNQRAGKVYVLPYRKGGFFRFWKKGGHGAPLAYRWDDQVRARIYNYVYFRGGNLASEGFELGLLAIREGTLNEVEQLIQLGVQSNGFDSTQLALWEHIRQYMEEDGPPLQPGDKLRTTDLSRVPEFPAEIIEEAGGPALDQDAIDQLVQAKRRQ